MRRVILFMSLLAVAAQAAAQPAPTPGVTPFASPDGVYRVTFPCRPSYQPVPGADDAGFGTSRMLTCDEGDFVAAVVEHAFAMLPSSADTQFTQFRDETVARVSGGKLTKDEPATRAGQPGRRIQVNGTDNVLSALIFILPESRRVYQVIAAMPRDRKAETRVERFLDSFTFVKTPAAAPTQSARSLAFLQGVSDHVNKTLPRAVDSETEMTSTSALEGVLIYNYRLVNLAAADVDPARLIGVMRPAVIRVACGELRGFVDGGVTIRFAYGDKERKPITQIDATGADCQ